MAVTLAELLAREVTIHWYENVAVARRLCTSLSGMPIGSDLPGLQHIELHPEGGIFLSGARATPDAPVARVGFIMHAMLGEDAPVQLRLLISKATLGVPMYGSVDELSRALGYFERPGRETHLAALYQRYLEAPLNPSPRRVALLTAADSAPNRPKEPKGLRWPMLAAGGAALTAIGVVGLLVAEMNGPRMSDVKDSVSNAVSSTSADLESAIGDIAGKVRDGLGISTPASSDHAAISGPAAAPVAPATRRRSVMAKGAAPAEAPARPEGIQVFDLESTLGATSEPSPSSRSASPAPPPSHSTETPPPATEEPLTIASVRRAARRSGATASRPAASRIFTVEDADVAPPVLEHEMLPMRLPPGLDMEDLAVMELIIGADGSVERVQLQNDPRSVLDSFMVSVAKAWVFQPAERDGEPVSYRKLIWITTH